MKIGAVFGLIKGMLYILSTPIGNLKDISIRALEILKQVDLILCEDTRVTQKLLSHYQIKAPLLSYHQHSQLAKQERILKELKADKNLALVSDAGTPGINDPGNQLIEYLLKELPELEILPIPGPCAALAGLSVSGFPADKFVFLGFPPVKKKRKKFFQEVAEAKYTVVFYESPHRIIKSLSELDEATDKQIVVGRELTKKFETIYRGSIQQVIQQIQKDKIKGEFVVIVNKS